MSPVKEVRLSDKIVNDDGWFPVWYKSPTFLNTYSCSHIDEGIFKYFHLGPMDQDSTRFVSDKEAYEALSQACIRYAKNKIQAELVNHG